MPATLLPASAKAFASRGNPNVVLGSKPEPWLTATLKRINRIKRPLNSVPQHTRCLTETLSAPSAIWTLCSLMLPKAPESKLRHDENPLIEGLFNYKLLHVEAYVVHVDMVSQNNEVAFKLTQDSIDSLCEYYKEIFLVDAAANTWNWTEKETQLKKLQEDFVQAINRYVYRAVAKSLEGLEEDGSGELLEGLSAVVKDQICGLFLPLLPPPPRAPEVIHPTPILPSSTLPETWWPSQAYQQQQDSWKMAPSSPSTTSSVESTPSMWTMSMDEFSTPSPSSAYSQPSYTTSCFDTTQYYSCPMTSEMTCAPMTCAPLMAPMLPSMLLPQCGVSAGGFDSYGGSYGWDRYNEYMSYAMPPPMQGVHV